MFGFLKKGTKLNLATTACVNAFRDQNPVRVNHWQMHVGDLRSLTDSGLAGPLPARRQRQVGGRRSGSAGTAAVQPRASGTQALAPAPYARAQPDR